VSDVEAVTTLEEDESPWGLDRVAVSCEACGRTWLAPASARGGDCLCGQGTVEASRARIPVEGPEALVPVRVDRERLQATLEARISSTWLLDRSVSAESLARRAVLAWWPRWLVDATVVGQWSAEVGFDYQARSSVERYGDGGWHTEERVENRIRWEPRVGQISERLHDVPVPALEDEHTWRQRLGAVPDDPAVPFHARALDGGWIELPDLAPGEVWHRAEPGFRRWTGRVVQQATRAQHVRDVHLDATYPDPTWTIALRPVWWTAYEDGEGRLRPVVVDALTGRRHGQLKASLRRALVWSAVYGTGVVVLWILAAVLTVVGIVAPPVLVVALITATFALVLTPAPFIPVIVVWWWNRREASKGVAKPM